MVARSMGNAHAVRVAKRRHCQRIPKTQMIEILRFAQKRSSPPEGAKGNDNTMNSKKH